MQNNCSIASLLDAAATARPDIPLLQDGSGTVHTVAEVAQASKAGVQWLWDAGIRPGMTVAWQLPSHVHAAMLMLTLARCMVRQAPIVHINRQREVEAAVKSCGADLLIVDQGRAEHVPVGTDVVELPPNFADFLQVAEPTAPHGLVADTPTDNPDWIYFTSGSTGAPKTVTHSDATLLTATDGFTTHLGLGSVANEVATVAFPVAHIGGIVQIVSAIAAGYSVLMVPKVDPDAISRTLTRHRVTVTGGSPTFYRLLLDAQLACGAEELAIPSLRMLIGGGAPCPEELHRRVRRHLRIPIVHAYGMTEAPMITVSKYTDTEQQQCRSNGAPIPGVDVRLGEDNEVQIRGAAVTPGYLDAEQWSAVTLADSWMRTGDTGRIRDDGRLVLTGRLKDLIIRKGEKVAPAEIEAELLAHPFVDDVVIIGQPDDLRGELVCAVVRRSDEHRDVTLDELCRFLAARGLMKQKWPERLVIVDSYPMTGLGKVARAELARAIGAAR
ncbi:class I adenylate-forming enzyme family protein [Mycobacterium genavense]|uniref:class I adenylate-forming enzyme family protein n=1 Tax=Mycobacterium genavense TaxID=36812 RepID=UPI00046ED030|nr:class I adenylate-forming enzyme family protein [Mycobacterium genavense]